VRGMSRLLGLKNKKPEACFIASFMYIFFVCVCDSLAGEHYDVL